MITMADRELPLPANVDSSSLVELLGPMPTTALGVGVARTVHLFRELSDRGQLPTRAYSD